MHLRLTEDHKDPVLNEIVQSINKRFPYNISIRYSVGISPKLVAGALAVFSSLCALSAFLFLNLPIMNTMWVGLGMSLAIGSFVGYIAALYIAVDPPWEKQTIRIELDPNKALTVRDGNYFDISVVTDLPTDFPEILQRLNVEASYRNHTKQRTLTSLGIRTKLPTSQEQRHLLTGAVSLAETVFPKVDSPSRLNHRTFPLPDILDSEDLEEPTDPLGLTVQDYKLMAAANSEVDKVR